MSYLTRDGGNVLWSLDVNHLRDINGSHQTVYRRHAAAHARLGDLLAAAGDGAGVALHAGPAAAAHGGGGGDAGHHAAGLGPAPVPQHRPGPRRHLRLDTALPHPQLAARQEKTLITVCVIAILDMFVCLDLYGMYYVNEIHLLLSIYQI